MLKFIITILLTGLLSFVAGLYLPWWGIAVAAFLVAAGIQQTRCRSFLSGFLGVFFLWGLLALLINSKNNGILAKKIALVLPLGGSLLLLILVTALIGGLVGGFAAWSASYLHKRESLLVD